MPRLEQICENFTPDNTTRDFRLWCTTYPSPVFPVSVLQNGVKMTIEPPKGLKANLTGSFSTPPIADEGFLDSCGKGVLFRKLLFSLCLFHALLQERRLFGPLGWNIPYGFNASDLEISIQQLRMFLDENESVPFAALKYCVGACNYGGRVTDAKDRRTLNSILDRFFNDGVVAVDNFSLSESGIYTIPPSAETLEDFLAWIEALPLVAEPEIFGFHENANITKDAKETNTLFATILLTEGGGSSGGASSNADDAITSTATEILNKVPAEFDIEAARVKYPVRRDESMNTVLVQELGKFNNLTKLIKSSLISVIRACKGEVVMTGELEKFGHALEIGAIPSAWKTKSYPSFKSCAAYVADLLARLEFFGTWLEDKPPNSYWISAFFFSHAFFTASKQNLARKDAIPIDALGFRYEMVPPAASAEPPTVGVYGYGLFFEAARWDGDAKLLKDSYPKVLFSPAPLMLFEPKKIDRICHPPGCYSCPVYKTGDRRGVLATTGHSTNFIMDILVPSDKPESHWIQRGTALLSQLD
ncbi:hypothetical protein CTAYLR_001133 [Chrysophaeum taylorii]|uniref:Dynein heavy chain n=1 Tax=Chrysophaeum taylorii TaxID=2483200 RepID=A0AAD7XUN3_9STRA|nr:hypothetical protein CTAYLR_001133 [Chrysophaeum taylorii]